MLLQRQIDRSIKPSKILYMRVNGTITDATDIWKQMDTREKDQLERTLINENNLEVFNGCFSDCIVPRCMKLSNWMGKFPELKGLNEHESTGHIPHGYTLYVAQRRNAETRSEELVLQLHRSYGYWQFSHRQGIFFQSITAPFISSRH